MNWAALAVIAAILVAVVLIIRKTRLAGVLLALLGVMFLFLPLFWVKTRLVSQAAVPHETSFHVDVAQVNRVREVSVSPVAWKAEVDETFLPDLYPSKEKARRDLGRRVTPLLQEALKNQDDNQAEFDATNQIIIHTNDQHPVDNETLNELQLSLIPSFPNTPITVSTAPPADESIEDAKHLDIEVTWEPKSGTSGEAGQFEVQVHRRHGSSLDTTARFVDAPWVFDDSEDDGNFLRVRTTAFESSRQQAESALRDAAADVLARVFRESPLTQGLPPDFDQRAVLRRALSRDEDQFFEDKFTQKLILTSGDKVYRSAARIDKNKLQPMFAKIVAQPRSWELPSERERSFFGSFVGLLLAVTGVFFGLKRITQRITESQVSN